jgi:catechol 2,3-dioxygenase-like lactoylglutathione lyase family enzyme
LKLGAFSVSLNVKDIEKSAEFYKVLNFKEIGGNIEQKWLILQSSEGHIIGLFEGMLQQNTLTFNPGWDQNAQNLDEFDDVRQIQTKLEAQGLEFVSKVTDETTGQGSLIIKDPDGNPILIDQHRG